jgi:tRNA dimethylallyltransferase
MSSIRALCLAGPTASGKTACSLALAAALPVEIVSVDSALVYRGMDIGTAKPTLAERAAVPHHLIDVVEPTEAYSAARFVAEAQALITDIHARGRIPLLAGGTMLYFKALFDGLDSLPQADAQVRSRLEDRAREGGWPALHAELARIDPVTAARLAPNDAQRIQRALEVWELSGQPMSGFHSDRFAREAQEDANADLPLLSLEPSDRAWLHERIARRFHAMLADGFVDEVRRLRARGDLQAGLPAMRCVGYRQAWEMLDANEAPGTAELAAFAERGIAATRQLAKRQITWLRGMPRREVAAGDGKAVEAAVVAWARRQLGA